jgi:hypothetical protein
MATKSGNKGRYICKVGFYDIYAKDSFKPKKTSKYNYAKADVASTEYNLVHAKKLVEKGFKTKDEAVNKANDIDLFNFSHINSYFLDIYDVGNFINNNITDNVGIHLDSYGRAWIGSNGEHIKMVSSERFGDINKVTINVYSPNNNNFNEVNYYKELLGVFDLNCCMAGLDRINNKIIYTEQFIDFLFTHKIEVTNTSQPLQTTIRLHNKCEELKSDTSNLDNEMELIQHSFFITTNKSIGPEWFEKTKIYRDLVLKYFTFKTPHPNSNQNIFNYNVKDFVVNNYFSFFYRSKYFSQEQLIIFWDIFVRGKNKKVFNTLVDFYKNKSGEEIFNASIMYSDRGATYFNNPLLTDFINILYYAPKYFDCDYTEEDINKISQHTEYVRSEIFVDPLIFLTDNIKDHIKMFEFIKKYFVGENGNFKMSLFDKVIRRVVEVKQIRNNKNDSTFNYGEKIKKFKNALNNTWIKHYPNKNVLRHRFKNKITYSLDLDF